MPDRHSKPCRPSATHIATSGSHSSPAATVSRAPSRSTPRVTIRATSPGTPSSAITTFDPPARISEAPRAASTTSSSVRAST